MAGRVRVTVVALLPINVKADHFRAFMENIIGKNDPAVTINLYLTTLSDFGAELSFAKISKVLWVDEIRDEWHLQITDHLRKAGCKKVAWRVTRVGPEVADPENTTESFPIELFRDDFTDDHGAIKLRDIAGEFGSEAFWESFEESK